MAGGSGTGGGGSATGGGGVGGGAAGRPDPLSRYEVSDVAVLRLLAHPLRARMLGLLRLEGEATASELGRRLGESSGSTSYHLRQLAQAGLIEESPVQASRRERVWRAAHALTSIDPRRFAAAPERAVLDEFSGLQLARLAAELRAFQGRQAETPAEWDAVAGLSDAIVRLSPAAASELSERISALLNELEERSGADPAASWVSVHWAVLPRSEGDVL